MDAYAAIAPVYDDWQHRHGDYSHAVLRQLLPTLRQHAPAARSLLDLGCGTGRLLLRFARQHPDWELAGLDASPAMLAQARRKSGAAGVRWIEAPLGSPLEAARYDVIGSFFNTLNHILDMRGLQRALRSAARALSDDGILIADMNNAAGYRAWWDGRQRFGGRSWRIDSAAWYEPVKRRAHIELHVDRGDQPIHMRLTERAYTRQELERCFATAGLRIVSFASWMPLDSDVAGAWWIIARRGQR